MDNLMLMLKEVAYNFYWSWNNEAVEVFQKINPDYWKWSMHNPVLLLNKIDPSYLEYVIEKKHLGNSILNIYDEYRYYMERKTFFEENYFKSSKPVIAYFSAEYGITECMRIYSGGLGVLSGDHLKSSSDLGIPLVGIGLAYQYGYFTQLINRDGLQTENYELNDFDSLPISLLRDENYLPLKIELKFPGRTVLAQAWQVKVGRVNLFLLDTAFPENTVDDRRITDILYGGNSEKRIMQEIVLGIGGVRLIEKLGYEIKAFHLNEGHSAFLCFERIRNCMKQMNLSYDKAKDLCYKSNIFTTHTPVPAGIDIFHKDLFVKYLKDYAEKEIGMDVNDLFIEGDLNPGDAENNTFNMAYLALKNSNFVNGVSRLHGEVSRKMWHLPDTRSQITSITNGIHTPSYVSIHANRLFSAYFTNRWEFDDSIWQRIGEISDEDVWALRLLNKMDLISFVRKKIRNKLIFLGDNNRLKEVDSILDPNALTIGFARRFATYKRGNLILRDPERLKKILNNRDMPVQIIYSGKAHPKDEQGKALISEILSFTKDEGLKNKIIFLDNYNIFVARHLVQGCDLWLNNPRRPQEASGTSGMKVIANGGLNLSILDGWWAEGYSSDNGWKIETITDENTPVEERDAIEAESLYSILESEIVPMFYKRNGDGIPLEWIRKVKSSMINLAGYFSTDRMVKEYVERAYIKAINS